MKHRQQAARLSVVVDTSYMIADDKARLGPGAALPGQSFTTAHSIKAHTNMLWWSGRLLVLAALLTAAAALDTEEIQKEEEGYLVEAARGPPENVAVVGEFTNALNVSWDPPGEEPSYYTVEAGTSNEITHDTFFLIEGLQPCTDYSIIVTSVYEGAGQTFPAFTDGETDISVPPAPPRCWFDNIDTTLLTAYWSDPNIQCPVTNHSISWTSHVLWNDEEDTGVAQTSGDHHTVRNLKPYTNVTVSVSAATEAGYGPSTTCWNVTLQDIPGAPTITNITSYERSLYVSWSPPEEANGVILQYVFSFENDHFKSNENVTGSVNTAAFSDIPVCDTYDVTAHATTEVGAGPESGSWNIHHSGAVPPSSVSCVLEEGGTETSVCWTPFPRECLDDPSTQYDITWKGDVLWSTDTDDGSGFLPWSEEPQLCYTAATSVPYTSYSLCVGVNGDVTDTACCSVQTPEAEPGPPVSLTVKPNEGSASVSWQPPDEANGIISIYEVRCESEHDSKVINVTGEDNKAEVDGLQACENYTISVRAMTEGGHWGPESDLSTITIDGPVAPSAVECSIVDGDVKVCWTPSPRYCPMDGYTVTWDGARLWTHNTDHVAGNSTEPWEDKSQSCHQLESSVPYAAYNVCVSVSGYDTVADCCQKQTPTALPGQPVLKGLQVQDTSVTVTWDGPEEENGVITGYLITSIDQNGDSVNQKANQNEYSSTFDNLRRCANHTITVQAQTSQGYGTPSKESYAVIPNTFADTGMTCSHDESRQVSLSWSLEVPDCPVSQFLLVWNTTVKWSNEHSPAAQVTIDGRNTSYVLQPLKPDTQVLACLSRDDESGPTTCCSSTTLEDIPGPPVLKALQVQDTSVTVSWDGPEEENGVITGYLVTYTDQDGNSMNQSANPNEYSSTINNLRRCANYLVSVQAETSAGLGDSDGRSAPIPNTFADTWMTCSYDESRQVSLSWSLEVPDCPVSQFLLVWNTTVKWSNEHSDFTTTQLAGDKVSYVQYGLKPYTDMTACLNIDTQESKKICCTGTTAEEDPSAPVNLRVKSHTASEATVVWSLPEELNGKLDSWFITWSGNTDGKVDIAPTLYTYELQDLKSSSTYTISLMARNGAGVGAPATVEVTTDESPTNVGLIVGVTLGVLIGIVVVGAGVFFYYRKKKHSNTGSAERNSQRNMNQTGAAGSNSGAKSTYSKGLANGSSVPRDDSPTNTIQSSRYYGMTNGSASASENYLTDAFELSRLNALKKGYVTPSRNGMTNGTVTSTQYESTNDTIYGIPRLSPRPPVERRRAPQPARRNDPGTGSDANTSHFNHSRDHGFQRQNNVGRNGHIGENRPRDPYSTAGSRTTYFPSQSRTIYY
ncbi:phosphatidylinositol phosphatase PTPRQ isoform X1 [Procambarus clarkii]|uniref:phosphatidylinositol phosphatase PTPRQ isoform X1 n=1 Tax=Procambarus clarkii TaxID=6728 RepID=UPI003743F49C